MPPSWAPHVNEIMALETFETYMSHKRIQQFSNYGGGQAKIPANQPVRMTIVAFLKQKYKWNKCQIFKSQLSTHLDPHQYDGGAGDPMVRPE